MKRGLNSSISTLLPCKHSIHLTGNIYTKFTPTRKVWLETNTILSSLTWQKNASPNALGSVSEAGVIGWDLPNAFISSCIFHGKGRMTLDPLSRNPSNAFWQRTKVGTYTKKLGVALMQCRNESEGKALALLRCKWLYPTHSNKEQDLWLLPSSANNRRQGLCKTNQDQDQDQDHNQDQDQDQVSSWMNYIPHMNLSYLWIMYLLQSSNCN